MLPYPFLASSLVIMWLLLNRFSIGPHLGVARCRVRLLGDGIMRPEGTPEKMVPSAKVVLVRALRHREVEHRDGMDYFAQRFATP